MYDISINATMVFTMLFTLLEHKKIHRVDFSATEYNCGVPYFKFWKKGEIYCIEITLGDKYSIYTYDEYFGGLGTPLYTGGVFDLNYYIANKL